MITLDLSILNQKGTPMFYSDTLALRPAFGIAGRIFIDIASPYGIYRDTGTSWQQIAVGSAGSGTITGGGTINTIAMFTPTGTAVGDSKITQLASDITIDANVYVTNGDINLPANNTVGGTTYAIQQVMATNDSWGIYGNAVAIDQGELVFELADNGSTFNPAGQRYRFHYEAVSSGANKDVLIIDYNLSTFTTALNVSHIHTALAGATNPYGEQVSVTNTFNAGITWTALLACFNTSSLQNNNWSGSATFGNASYTANNLNLSSIEFLAAGSTITNTQASGGIRAWANQILQLRINGTNNGTYTHYANSAVYGDYASSTARLIITNRYGYLVNDLDEYTAGHTYTNRWAFYNAGVNDNNHFAGKTAFGSTTLIASAQVAITSTTKGFLLPRMTNAQRVAIVSPVVGLMVYCTDATEGTYEYISTGWRIINAGGGGGMSIGGTVTGGTTGSVLFVGGSSVLAQNNGNLFWDTVWNRLCIGNNVSVNGYKVDITGGIKTSLDCQINQIDVGAGGGGNVFNCRLGNGALGSNSSGSSNVAIGYQSMAIASTGISNVAIGVNTLRYLTASSYNTAIGYQSLFGNPGANNTSVGATALQSLNTGANNTAIGYEAGNVAGSANASGSNNIYIGASCSGVTTTDSNRTFIGNGSTTSSYIAGNLLVGSKTDSGQKFQVTGTVRINGQTAATAGGSAGLHLILNLDGTNYKIALLNV